MERLARAHRGEKERENGEGKGGGKKTKKCKKGPERAFSLIERRAWKGKTYVYILCVRLLNRTLFGQ